MKKSEIIYIASLLISANSAFFNEATLESWNSLLCDVDYAAAEHAVKKLILTSKEQIIPQNIIHCVNKRKCAIITLIAI